MARVIVFGSINIDCVAQVKKHPAPGETLLGSNLQYHPGGKGANQAVAAARLGAQTFFVGKVGNDNFSNYIISFLKEQQVDTTHIESAQCATGVAFIAIDDGGENTIIVIPGANDYVTAQQLRSFSFTKDDMVLFQNEIPPKEMIEGFKLAKQSGATIIYNPAPAISVNNTLFEMADYLIVNESEFEFYKSKIDTSKHICINTMGAKGVKVYTATKTFTVESHKVSIKDTTGAGDCFVGAFASSLLDKKKLVDAVKFANKAASLSIKKDGASSSMPFLSEIK